MRGGELDLQQIRRAIRRSGNETIFFLLDDALSILPPAKLRQLIAQYMKTEQFVSEGAVKRDLLTDVQAFQKACLAGDYYEAFDVNSKNCTQSSLGTLAWIADFRRLLFRCVEQAKKRNLAGVRCAFDILFELLDRFDDADDRMFFFADEGGSWMVGIDWKQVLPAWFRVLAAMADPAEFARRFEAFVGRHCNYQRAELLAEARQIATPAQRQALAKS
ncbi:MAG: hypothetical protein ACP5E2_13710 [Terracidiphilus sp.]